MRDRQQDRKNKGKGKGGGHHGGGSHGGGGPRGEGRKERGEARKERGGAPWWRNVRDTRSKERPAPAGEDHEEGGGTGGGGTAPGEKVVLFGMHPVEAALANPKRLIGRLQLTENAQRRLEPQIKARGVVPQLVAPKDLDRRLGNETVHQGVMLETQALPEPTLEELAEAAKERPLVVLDQVTDPHNVGAILRSAAVFGAAGLVMTRRHSPPLDGTLAKSASGALEHVPISLVANLARAIEELKDLGFLVVGLDGEAPQELAGIDWAQRVALVLGAEGKGLRQLTRERCDQLCRIAAEGPIASLNVSNAAAVSLHFASFRRRAGK